MKKLVLVFVAVAAMSFVFCVNIAAQEAPVAVSDSIAAGCGSDSVVCDSDSVEAPAEAPVAD